MYLKIKKGRRVPAVGAGGRGARCALQPFSPARPPLGFAPRPPGEGIWPPLGQEAAELRPGRADCPRSGLRGKSPPARCPPRCAAFPKQRLDRALLVSYPSLPIPAERSRSLSPPLETAGEAPKN